ncbi:hypothetical protein EV379_1161 [Microterricola gilva]|uniref:DUF2231 domain-containing protein n=1 Tax=Microterricola gilva TaxID=393267 RepID=A0A4Q8AK24_9MICO|nr:hypothetical protein [Microterricola gilva]RZU64850.1 hypothetical protein EV379_1161 [Microterricola gilva]
MDAVPIDAVPVDYVVNGLPLHALIVHVVVVLVPVVAVTVLLAACWPAARRWLGIIPPLGALALLGLVPLTTLAGQWLQARVGEAPLIQAHAALGVTLYPWVIALTAVAVLQWLWYRLLAPRTAPTARVLRRVVGAVLIVAALIVATGSIVTVVRIGESGSRAIWDGTFSDEPLRG